MVFISFIIIIIIAIFILLQSILFCFHRIFFSVTGAHVLCCLNLFVYPFVGPGAHGQVVCTAGYGGGSISGKGWVAGQPQGCFGHLSSTCNECC